MEENPQKGSLTRKKLPIGMFQMSFFKLVIGSSVAQQTLGRNLIASCMFQKIIKY